MSNFRTAVYDIITGKTWRGNGIHIELLDVARREFGLPETHHPIFQAVAAGEEPTYDNRFLCGYAQEDGMFLTRAQADAIIKSNQ